MLKQLRIKTAVSDRIIELVPVGRLAELGAIFQGLISGVRNVLHLSGTWGKNILKGLSTNQACIKVIGVAVV